MATLLRIDSSSREEGSNTRSLGDHFVQSWAAANLGGRVIDRDLIAPDVPHLQADTIRGYFTPPDLLTPELLQATRLSDSLVAELQSATEILITAPMYNFSVPASLKAWIDQIVRIGHTFSYDGTSFTGLVKAERAYLICAYGAAGYVNGGPFSGANFLEPYLRFLMSFLGVKDVEVISIESTSGDPKEQKQNFALAKSHIDGLFSTELAEEIA